MVSFEIMYDKKNVLCYNQLQALYFCKYNTTAFILSVRIILKRW